MNHTKRSFNVLAATVFIAGTIALSTLAEFAAAADYEIANGLDPITTGQAMGNFQGGKVLLGEYLPGEGLVLTAERKR